MWTQAVSAFGQSPKESAQLVLTAHVWYAACLHFMSHNGVSIRVMRFVGCKGRSRGGCIAVMWTQAVLTNVTSVADNVSTACVDSTCGVCCLLAPYMAHNGGSIIEMCVLWVAKAEPAAVAQELCGYKLRRVLDLCRRSQRSLRLQHTLWRTVCILC
jgi:hypothetical protein